MKLPARFLSLLTASAFLSAPLHAEEVTTDPVGVVSVTVPGDGALTLVSVPLRESTEFSGSVSSVSGSEIEFENAAFDSDEFAQTESPYFVFSNSEDGAGTFFLVLSNSETSVTVDPRGFDLTDFFSDGDNANLAPGNTLESVFGSGEDAILEANNSSGAADNLIFWAGTGWQTFWIRNDGNWYSSLTGGSQQNNFIIYPDEGFFVKRSGEPLELAFSGAVPLGRQSLSIAGGGALSLKTHQFPVDVKFSELGLDESDLWSSNNQSALADQILLWTGQGWQTFWIRGDGNWYSSLTGGNVQNEASISAGTSFFVRYVSGSDGSESSLFFTPPYDL